MLKRRNEAQSTAATPYSTKERDFFENEHAIDVKIAVARPYERWEIESSAQTKRGQELTAASRELLKARYSGLSTAPTIVRWANQTSGCIINRHAVPGAAQIFPEIRGDSPIATAPATRHYHGSGSWQEIEELRSWPEWRRRKHVRTADWGQKSGHVRRDKYEDDHLGVNSDVVHNHRNLAKYTFPPSPKERREGKERHEHGHYQRRAALAKHIEQKHDGVDIPGEHDKYTYRYRVPTLSVAKRIDIHPQALFRFKDARIVYFALEGCLKADAILSYICKLRLSAAVFSVPSVTLWAAAELEDFISRYLLPTQPAVIIVTDSDWNEIPAVATQARLCQTALLRIGLRTVHVAAPQPGAVTAANPKGKQGIDDFLATGNSLEDMEVIFRMPAPGLYELVRGAVSKRAFERAYWALRGLSIHADTHGRYQSSVDKLVNVTGWPRNRIYRGKEDLEAAGLIKVDGEFVFRRNRFHQDEWEGDVAIILCKEAHADDEIRRRLGDLPWASDTYRENRVRGRLRTSATPAEEAVLS